MAGKGWFWPCAIVALLVASAGANIGLMLVASRDASFAVEPDYYRKAVEWDRTMAQEATNDALGWSLSARFAADGRATGGRLVIRVLDRSGAALTGARVAVHAFPSARASQIFRAALDAEGAGVYSIAMAPGPAGLWEVRVTVTRGADVFTRALGAERREPAVAATTP